MLGLYVTVHNKGKSSKEKKLILEGPKLNCVFLIFWKVDPYNPLVHYTPVNYTILTHIS